MLIKNTGFPTTQYSQMMKNRDTAKVTHTAKDKAEFSVCSKVENQSARTDKIELSSHQDETGSFLSGLKNSICEDIERDSSTARIQYLKGAVQNGKYAVDSKFLTGALLFDD